MLLYNWTVDNVMIYDIMLKFIIFTSLVYILYKFFLVDLITKYIIQRVSEHVAIYKDSILDLKNIDILNEYLASLHSNYKIKSPNADSILEKRPIDILNEYLDEIITSYQRKSSNADPTTNDNNMMIIFVVMLVSIVAIAICVVIFFGDIKIVGLRELLYNTLFTLIFLVVSQLIFFYIIFSFFDPLVLYKILYYPYGITPVNTSGPTGIDKFASTSSANLTTNPSRRSVDLTDYNTALIFSFMIVAGICFLITAIIALLSGLSLYTGVNLKYLNPALKDAFVFKMLCVLTVVFLFAFIILLVLLLSRL